MWHSGPIGLLEIYTPIIRGAMFCLPRPEADATKPKDFKFKRQSCQFSVQKRKHRWDLRWIQRKSHLEQKSEENRPPKKWPFWGEVSSQRDFWPFFWSDPSNLFKNHTFWNNFFQPCASDQDQCEALYAQIYPIINYNRFLSGPLLPTLTSLPSYFVTISISSRT